MQQSEQINELAEALAKAQAAIVSPPKNRTVSVQSQRGAYTFDYATLDAILDAVRAPLADNGLSFVQALTGTPNDMKLTTRLMHKSGQWLQTETPVTVQGPGMQAIGSAQTYARRYAISSLLGVVADEDDDANTADGNGVADKREREPKNTGRSATPKQDAEPWKDMAEKIKKSIDDAQDTKELEGVMKAATGHLETIKGKSETAYTFLMERSLKRAGVLAQAPAEKKVA